MKVLNLFLLFISISLLISCAESDDSVSESSSDSSVETGVFLDSAVEGAEYSSDSQSGITDEDGTFKYIDGETISFSIGGVTLGTASGASSITPVNFVPSASNASNDTVVNIARFLQTLDSDGDPNNGIQITEEVRNTIKTQVQSNDYSIQFDVSTEVFGSNSGLNALIVTISNDHPSSGRRTALVDKETAFNHLSKTIAFQGDGFLTTTIKSNETFDFSTNTIFTNSNDQGKTGDIAYITSGDAILRFTIPLSGTNDNLTAPVCLSEKLESADCINSYSELSNFKKLLKSKEFKPSNSDFDQENSILVNSNSSINVVGLNTVFAKDENNEIYAIYVVTGDSDKITFHWGTIGELLDGINDQTLLAGERFDFSSKKVSSSGGDIYYNFLSGSGQEFRAFSSSDGEDRMTRQFCASGFDCTTEEIGKSSFEHIVKNKSISLSDSDFEHAGQAFHFVNTSINVQNTGKTTIFTKTADNELFILYPYFSSSEKVMFHWALYEKL